MNIMRQKPDHSSYFYSFYKYFPLRFRCNISEAWIFRYFFIGLNRYTDVRLSPERFNRPFSTPRCKARLAVTVEIVFRRI